ncbi:hypothetical protein BKI52_12960 [marine bacterium AO1-C]|nr:hypothetical protein BKI52_12960 [marine bacterium AO1-C]
MKKSLTKFFSLIALAGVVFFSSCGSSDDAVAPSAPTISIADAGNGSYETGDSVTYNLTAKASGGVKILNFTKTVDGTESAATGFSNVTPGDTNTINATFKVPVTEAAGKTVTITVNITDNSDQSASATATYTVVATGLGGGGAAPLVKGSATLTMGTQGNPTDPSYLSTATQTDGTIGKTFKSSEAVANQGVIDIFFGATNVNGTAAAQFGTTALTSMVSPSEVTGANLWGTPLTSGRATKFAASSLTDVNVTAIDVENNISSTTGNSVIAIEKGKVYSFVTAGGKKGYILVEDIINNGVNGSNEANRQIKVKFAVQQ